MGILNIQTGRQKAVQVLGVKELQQNVNRIMSAMVGEQAVAVSVTAGRVVLGGIMQHAQSVNLPQRAMQDIFLYSKQPSALFSLGGDSVNVLVGLRKKGTRLPAQGYVEWGAGHQVGAFEKKPRLRKRGGTLKLGGTIGENLGTMWELGTTKMAARPWFRPAVQESRPEVYGIMQAGYAAIIASNVKP